MTAQAPDICVYKGKRYSIIGRDNTLFDPEDWGIQTRMWSTRCYRGYIAEFEIRNSEIYLQNVSIGCLDKILPINGVLPDRNKDRDAIYSHINMKLSYSGHLRLATDLHDECYINMGFQKASAFRVVLDLIFENGMITKETDRTEDMKEKRGSFKRSYKEFINKNKKTKRNVIDEAFSLDMDLE